MTDLGTLTGGTTSNATGVSADGKVIVGTSTVTGGYTHAFVYANDSMLDANEWIRSLNGANSVVSMASSLASQPMEGAHHRSLMSYDRMGKQSVAWATGDFGMSTRQSDNHVTAGEVGASTTCGNIIAGLAAGHGSQNQDLIYGGSAQVAGNYILGEIDARLPGQHGILSAVVVVGSWQANTYRGYATGSGTQFSIGSTRLTSECLRLRYDGPALRRMNHWSVSPFVSWSVTCIKADAFVETGGSFPAYFDALAHTSQQARLGLTMKYLLGADTTLHLTGEWIHRFDPTTATLTGNDILHGALPFSAAGLPVTGDQARLGVDVDHLLTADTLLNFSVYAAGFGQSPNLSMALSIRRAF
jgi:probable HAF family extracellular repeat protein